MNQNLEQLRFPIIKKHFLTDSPYQLIKMEKQLLFEQQKTHTIRYNLEISYKNVVFWKLTKRENKFVLSAVGILHQNNIKFFYSNSENLQTLKQQLNQKIFFGNLNELYNELSFICEGAFGQVSKLQCKLTSVEVACKKINKHRIDQDTHNQIALFDEIKILQQFNHKNLLHLKELFRDEKNYYIVYDYLRGGTLKQMIYKKSLTHSEINTIMKALLSGLVYMHKQGIMHRDIKPDNIMFREPDDLNSIVIIDFGFAQMVGQQQMNLRNCGSPGYIAPEVINNEKNYDSQCDVFSVGAILYEMNTQKKLFEGSTQDEVLFKNKQCNIKHVNNSNFRFEDLRYITLQMLQINPKNRISSQQCLNFFQPHEFQHFQDDVVEEENGAEKQLVTHRSIKVQSQILTAKIQ